MRSIDSHEFYVGEDFRIDVDLSKRTLKLNAQFLNRYFDVLYDCDESYRRCRNVASISSHNPYWDKAGKTFLDPVGYRVVFRTAIGVKLGV